MYCSKCANQVSAGLKFCSNCGTRIVIEAEDKDGMPGKMLDNILTTLFLIVMFGLGILVGLVAVLLSNDVTTDIVLKIAVIYLVAIFGISFMLARQVPKLIDAKLRGFNLGRDNAQPSELKPPSTARLEEYRQPAASIIDHTTKTLDKIPVERN